MENGFGDYSYISELYNIIENLYGKELIIITGPYFDQCGPIAYIDLGCAININSKHKNDAFKFIEYLLSKHCQYSNDYYSSYFPVNIEAYYAEKEDFLNDHYYHSHYEFSLTPIPDDFKNTVIYIIEDIREYRYIGQEEYIFRNIIRGILVKYLEGIITYEQMIEDINSNLRLYLSE